MSQSQQSSQTRAEMEWAAVLALGPFIAPSCVTRIVSEGAKIIGDNKPEEIKLNFDVTMLSALSVAAASKLVDAFLERHPDFRLPRRATAEEILAAGL